MSNSAKSDQLLHFALFISYTGQQLAIFDQQQTKFEKHKLRTDTILFFQSAG